MEHSLFHQLIYQLFNLAISANRIIDNRTLFAHKLAESLKLLNHQTNSRLSESPRWKCWKEKGESFNHANSLLRVSGFTMKSELPHHTRYPRVAATRRLSKPFWRRSLLPRCSCPCLRHDPNSSWIYEASAISGNFIFGWSFSCNYGSCKIHEHSDKIILKALSCILKCYSTDRSLGNEERSEERRVGKECVASCRSRWSPYH